MHAVGAAGESVEILQDIGSVRICKKMDRDLVRAQTLYVIKTRFGSKRVADEDEQGNAETQAGQSRKS
jgi:hypothetical protein